MFFCHYALFDHHSDKWVDLVCWGSTPDAAFRGVKEQCEHYDRDPLAEHVQFGKSIKVEVQTRTVEYVAEVQ